MAGMSWVIGICTGILGIEQRAWCEREEDPLIPRRPQLSSWLQKNTAHETCMDLFLACEDVRSNGSLTPFSVLGVPDNESRVQSAGNQNSWTGPILWEWCTCRSGRWAQMKNNFYILWELMNDMETGRCKHMDGISVIDWLMVIIEQFWAQVTQ